MIRYKNIVRELTLGGIISPQKLLQFAQAAEELGIHFLHLGSRQDIFFTTEQIKDIHSKKIKIQNIGGHNIQSSYVALDIHSKQTSWLNKDIYTQVLTSFSTYAKLKINVIDPLQGLVPMFAGHLNFIASEQPNHWFLFVRNAYEYHQTWQCPTLIHSDKLPIISKYIEDNSLIYSKIDWNEEWEHMAQVLEIKTIEGQIEFNATNEPLLFYEGFHAMKNDQYWLGLYWRDNNFPIFFIKAICVLCINNGIEEIRLSPWKSILIAGISSSQLIFWEKLLGKLNINIRHSALELHWHLPILDQNASALKDYIVRCLHQQDISTHGLTFSIKNRDRFVFTSVVIERNHTNLNWELDSYNLLYAHNFNPNSFKYHYFVKEVSKEVLPPLLLEISKNYYTQHEAQKETLDEKFNTIYQCIKCFEIYEENQLQLKKTLNTAHKMPKEFCCTNCGADKKNLVEMAEKIG